MNKEGILAEWQQVTDRLSALIVSFAPERFYRQPAPDRWSPAQQAEHLLKVDGSTWP